MKFNPFSQKIGIVGGGHQDMPAFFVNGSLTSRDKILELAKDSDILTYEIEHIDVQTLIELKDQGKVVIPDPDILRIIQDKSLQKSFYAEKHIATSPFEIFNDEDSLSEALPKIHGDKLVVKSAKGGYDGKGVWILTRSEISSSQRGFQLDGSDYVLEAFIPRAREFAVIVARGMDGETKSYPSCEMVFDPELNLVDYLISPSNISTEQEEEIEALALKAVKSLGGAGLFAVELFLDEKGFFYVNEIAPRPHNSGHHSIEANSTSQYEQLNRILLGLPLGETDLRSPVVMMNLLGDSGVTGA